MISNKELQYVGAWESKAPFPGVDYAKETLEEMQKRYEEYNSKLRDKSLSILFSDASECEFEIFESNLCHLLGVNYKWLSEGLYNGALKDVLGLDPAVGFNSYTLLTKILENQDDVIAYDRSASLRILNYYKTRIKSSIFHNVEELENFNFGMISAAREADEKESIDIEKDEREFTTRRLPTKDAKFLYMQSNEPVCPYFFVLIDKSDEQDSKYYVRSLLSPTRGRIKNFFEDSGQPVIPTQIIIDDKNNLRKIEATADDKIQMINLHSLISKDAGFDIRIDPYGDYLAMLMGARSEKPKVYVNK